MNDVCDSCCTNHGCGETSWTRSVYWLIALIPTALRSAPQFDLQLLYASAPLIPKNWYA